MTDFTLRPLTVPERKYTYAQSSQLQGQTGNIGYLRGDFGSSGNQFYTTWFDTRPQWKSDEFKRDLDDVINALRSEECGLLQSRSQMVRYGRENKESEMQGAYTTEFGFRADTEKYAFVLRCNPTRGDYNFYCLCYVKEWLDKHIEEANRDIRFIDSHYKELFRIPDGERIIVTDRDGKTESYPCRYIDSYHTEVGRNLFHICEFAERMEQGGCTYAPMEPPLPPMCYSILPSTGEVIQIDRWQKGYTATRFNDGNRAENQAIKDMFEFLGTPRYAQWNIKVHFSAYTGEWNIEGKSYDRSNVKAYSTYGTGRINAYKIIEETLNLKDVRIFDYVEDADGKKKAILNKKETAIAQAKQELIKQGFQDWVWSDPERRERLCRLYNDKFNSLRPREYDGSHIVFSGMNPEIELREHQRNAVAHILYGGNTLLAHAVGAGKTFEMVSAAMESKRLGLCSKSLFVVPNHLTEQWASEFLQLYPSANILVATKKDFETKNRKKFCGRIATGDYDAIIIGHSQFEKIPMSIERQRAILEQQLDEVTEGIAELKKNRGDNFSVKQLERTKKSVKQKLDKLNDQSKKDDTVTFEDLGVDRLFIDESHYYKNLFLFTKMRNVGGIAQTEAMKSSDLFMKCRYLDELTGGRGVVFATGTPISNSMVELYTIQRYLQYNTLVQNNLQHFDAWASTFGETITAVELTPEGTGYRAKTRFARFYNLPELMAMFKEIADIKTADMLALPVPTAVFHNISVKPSEIQKQMVAELAERAERVRNGMVDARVDNMLKITNDGRKLALDQRLINPLLPDFEDSKLNACVDAMFETWERGSEKRLTQLFFCDLSTPKNDGSFNVYDDIRQKLIARGVPADEIRFIHEADTEAKKLELFKKVRRGDVRILMGSTQKMGAGTNVQNKLAASSDLDCPWRPSDLEQRLGRSIRQGNENAEVHIYRFVTEETFDAYLYQLVEGKQKFASQIMTSKSPVRSCEDIDETALSYAEIKMLATGNPHIKEKMDLDIQVQKLRLLKSSFLSEKYALEDKIIKFYPQEITRRSDVIAGLKSDMERVAEHPKPSDETFVGMTVKGAFYSEKADAGNAILEACKAMTNPDPIPLGEYRGFTMELYFEAREYKVRLKGELGYPVTLGTDTFGNITRLDNALEGLPKRLEMNEMELDNIKKQFETAKVDVERPFPQEEELKAKTDRLNELNALLNVDKRENEIVGGEPDEGEELPEKKPKDLER